MVMLHRLADNKWKRLFLVLAAIALLCAAFVSFARATQNGTEAEEGILSGNACSVSDTTASNGQAVRFGSPTACTAGNPLAGLPLVPWEGGPAYWNQFPKAVAGGWTDPTFFPILIFYNSFSSESEVQFDKGYGINSYVEGYPDYVDYQWLQNNGMYWLSSSPNASFPPLTASAQDSAYWPGIFLDDEPDGRFGSAQNDLDYVLNTLASNPENERFRTFNFTQIVAGNYGDSNNTLYTQMINSYRGPISVDVYWYTIPNCGPGNPAYDNMIYSPSDPAHCRTSSSYGKTIKSLRQRDAADGTLKPIWQFIENLNGGPGEGPFYANITPGQLKGAAMDSIINEARGLFWFNSSLTGPCVTGGALRIVEYDSGACSKPQMDAMKEVNLLVTSLAPVINTQSYQYTFGPKLDTMLKWYNGSAYIFAMINGDTDSTAGNRTFVLPAGLASVSSVEVLNESRSIPVVGGQFTDNFAAEYTYHIYKLTPAP